MKTHRLPYAMPARPVRRLAARWHFVLISTALAYSCSKSPPPPRETSKNWQPAQISLTGEWYPSVALIGASDSLDIHLRQILAGPDPPKSITLYLDQVLTEEILPEHRVAYDAALEEILSRAREVASINGTTLKRGQGGGAFIDHSPGAVKSLAVQARIHDGGGITITITNQVKEPFSWVTYSKEFRGKPRLHEEHPFPQH